MTDAFAESQAEHYAALTEHAGWAPLVAWTQLEMTGRDRVSFLHGMCTNDIRGLTAGRGCEAFVTTGEGRTLSHIFVFASEQRFDIVAVPGQSETLQKHWDRYIIREDVQIRDVSSEQSLLLIAGSQAPQKLEASLQSSSPRSPLEHTSVLYNGIAISLRRLEDTPPVFWLNTSAADVHRVTQLLVDQGIRLVGEEAWEMLRLELGFPLFDRDVTLKNLPQEVDRDHRAISFQKGCYLGQETVARIDALGHVNWKMMAIKLPSLTTWAPGMEIKNEDKTVARVTSVAFSPKLRAPVALAYVRRGWDQPGRRLPAGEGEAEVLSLPLWDQASDS